MWEATHAALGSDVDAAIFGGFLSELVFVNNLIRDVTQFDLNEFSTMQRCHEVEVGDVCCHESRNLCGDDTIEKHFGHHHFCGQGGYFAWVVDSVTPYYESHSVGFYLFWSDCAYELPVCDVFYAACQYLMLEDKLNSVGRVLYATSNAICQLPKFIGC